jgi:hypothetical protein
LKRFNERVGVLKKRKEREQIMQHSKAVYKITKYSAYEFTHDYTSITDVLDRLNARPEYDDGRYEYLYHENDNPPYFELFDGYEGDDLTLLQGEFLLIDPEGRLSKLSSEEATQIILKGEGLFERIRV